MFKSIEINRFRGIKYCKVDGLNRVNLFFGKNNCGKSSLLDAVFLISGLSNPKLPLNVNILRGYKKLYKSDILLDFFALDPTKPISIKANNNEFRELNIWLVESSSSKVDLLSEDNNIASTAAENRYGLTLKFTIDGQKSESAIILSQKNEGVIEPKISLDPKYKETILCRYLNPQYDFYTSVKGLLNAVQNKDENFIVEALRLIEPGLKDFVLFQNEILVDVGYEKRIPINMMGDGARKILTILSSIYECRNGILLIDEISNGFHYSVMKQLWQSIIAAANKNNVQIYATTHDYDSIKGLKDAAIESEEGRSVSCFKLQKSADSELKSYHYSLESIDYSINQKIEIR